MEGSLMIDDVLEILEKSIIFGICCAALIGVLGLAAQLTVSVG